MLKKIAEETGGKFYLAQSQEDMRRVYRDIDQLERSNYETDIYSDFIDLYFFITILILALLFLYLFLNYFVWFGV